VRLQNGISGCRENLSHVPAQERFMVNKADTIRAIATLQDTFNRSAGYYKPPVYRKGSALWQILTQSRQKRAAD
jgi:hypothetical protein